MTRQVCCRWAKTFASADMAKNINTENSGSWYAARTRQVSASAGPTPSVRQNIGSMALDAVIGKAQCCPRTILPNPPTNLRAVPGVGSATIYFTPGYDYDIDPITNYAYSLDRTRFKRLVPAQITSPIVITGLTNGVTYTIYLIAINNSGVSVRSEPVTVTPTPLAPPRIVLTLAADSGLYIYFTPGSGSGSGSQTATNYQYTLDGGATYTTLNPPTTANPIFIPGLVNGVSYTVQLVALNDAGFKSFSSNALSGTPTANVNPTGPTLNIDPTTYSGSGPVIAASGLSGSRRNVAWIRDPAIGVQIFNFSFPLSYIAFPAAYNFGPAITVTAWIKPSSTTNAYQFSALLGTTNFNVGWNSYALGSPPSKSLLLRGSGIETDSSNNVVTYGTWQHVGYVFDPIGATILCFVNGFPVTMNDGIATAPNIQTLTPFYIGAQSDGSNSMTASLGYVRAYGYRFTQTDMFSEYVSTKGLYGL